MACLLGATFLLLLPGADSLAAAEKPARKEGPGRASSPAEPTARDKASAIALIAEGLRLLEERHFHESITCLEKAAGQDPTSTAARDALVRARTALGVEYTNSGESSRARETFAEALRVGESPVARLGLGYLDFLDSRDASARENLEKAIAADPREARAHKLLALIEYRRGETPAALREIDRSIELDPKDEEARAFKKRWAVEEKLSSRMGESSSRHFLVRHDRLIPDGAVREILDSLEKIHGAIGQALGHWPEKKITVLLLSDRDFQEATGSFHWVGGVYDGQIKIPVASDAGRPGAGRQTLIRTLRHEFTHVVIKELSPGCPNWLNEGIAQYFEIPSPREEGGEAAAAAREDRRIRTAEALRAIGDRRIPFEKVPPRMWEISDPALARVTYLEGLGFVSFLVEKYQAFRLRILLTDLRREGSLTKAFESTYGASLQDLERLWWAALPEPSDRGSGGR